MNDTTGELNTGREVVETSGKVRMTDIVVDGGGVSFANFGQAKAYAMAMSEGDVAVPEYLRGNVGACLAIIDDAVRVGVSPWVLARESYSIKNQIAYSAKMIHAIILKRLRMKKRPQFVYQGEGNDLSCTVIYTIADDDIVEYTSPKIGEITTKNSPLWKTDVRQQIGYYSTRAAARLHFPEIMLGLYTPEEREALTVDVTPRTSGVSRRLAAPDAAVPTHAETVKREMGAAGPARAPDTPAGSGGSLGPRGEKNAPATAVEPPDGFGADLNPVSLGVRPDLRPTATSSGGEEESSTGATQEPSQPEAGEEGEAFTLTQDERDWLYSLTEDLAGVTTMNELNVVVVEYADLEERFSRGAQEIAGQRIAKKLDALAAKAKKRAK